MYTNFDTHLPNIGDEFSKAAEIAQPEVRDWNDITSKFKYKLQLANLDVRILNTGRVTPFTDRLDWYYPDGEVKSVILHDTDPIIVTAEILCNDTKIHPLVLKNGCDGLEYYIIPSNTTVTEQGVLYNEMLKLIQQL